MNRFALLFIFTLFLASFGHAQCGLYESEWIDKAKEFNNFEIVKEGDSYYMQHWVKDKLEIQGDGPYFVDVDNRRIQLVLNRESGELILGKTTYIPEFKSKKRRFEGRWQNEELQITHDITITNGGVNWAITKSTDKPIRFWPKRTESGYTFTFGEEQLYFTIEDGMLCDANGNKFQQVGSY